MKYVFLTLNFKNQFQNLRIFPSIDSPSLKFIFLTFKSSKLGFLIKMVIFWLESSQKRPYAQKIEFLEPHIFGSLGALKFGIMVVQQRRNEIDIQRKFKSHNYLVVELLFFYCLIPLLNIMSL